MTGGDPDRMTLRRFIDVAFAVLVEEYQRLGVDLLSAIDKVGALGRDESEPVVEVEKVAQSNQESMQQLLGMLSGVKGAPV